MEGLVNGRERGGVPAEGKGRGGLSFTVHWIGPCKKNWLGRCLPQGVGWGQGRGRGADLM